MRMVGNSNVIIENVEESLLEKPTVIPQEFLGNMFIMRKSFPNSMQLWSMFGKMTDTDVNIWNYPMTVEEMTSWTSTMCDDQHLQIRGNIVNWETAEWMMKGIEEEQLTTKEICHPNNELCSSFKGGGRAV